MNATANRLTTTVMVAAAIAAFVMLQPAKVAPAAGTNAVSAKAPAVVMLPKVTVTGKREKAASIVYLQRVVVTGKRVDNRNGMQAQKDNKPAAMLIAMR